MAKYDIPDSLRKEIRRTAAIAIWESHVASKESMAKKDQELIMHKFFYGDGRDDTISYLRMICTAERDFADMFEANPDYSGKKRIKPAYSRASQDYNLGEEITRNSIERVKKTDNNEVVSGCYLREDAK